MTDPVYTPDTVNLVQMIITGGFAALPTMYDDELTERLSIRVLYPDTVAEDLAVYAEAQPYPDLIDVCVRGLVLTTLRLTDLGDSLPFVMRELLTYLAEENDAGSDLAGPDAFEQILHVIDYVDFDDPAHLAAVRVWLSGRIFATPDTDDWVAIQPFESQQLGLLDMPGSPVEPDPGILNLLMPPPSMRRAVVATNMTGPASEDLRAAAQVAHDVATRLRESGFNVHEPTATRRCEVATHVTEAIDMDKLAGTDVLIVLSRHGATGLGVLLGKATHTGPLRLVVCDPRAEQTPLIDHIRECGGVLRAALEADEVMAAVEDFIDSQYDAVERRVARRLGWERYRPAHEALCQALRAARHRPEGLAAVALDPWRLAQLERRLEHFAQVGLDELRVLADGLGMPAEWRAQLLDLHLADASPPPTPVQPQPAGGVDEVPLFSVADVSALIAEQRGRPEEESPRLLRVAATIRLGELTGKVPIVRRLKLDSLGWRSLRKFLR